LRWTSVSEQQKTSRASAVAALDATRRAFESSGLKVSDATRRGERFDLWVELGDGRSLRVEVKQMRWVRSLENRLAELTYAAVQDRIDLAVLVEMRDDAVEAFFAIPAEELRAGVPGLQEGRTLKQRMASYQLDAAIRQFSRSSVHKQNAATSEQDDGVALTPP